MASLSSDSSSLVDKESVASSISAGVEDFTRMAKNTKQYVMKGVGQEKVLIKRF